MPTRAPRPPWATRISPPSATGCCSPCPKRSGCGSTRASGCGTRCRCGWSRRISRAARSCRSWAEAGAGMPRTVVVLPVGGEVVPTAALPALRATAHVIADDTVPEKVAVTAGAVPGPPAGVDWVLLTTDLAQAPAADEVIVAPRGTALLDAVAVMDRLRSPGGCPWDAEQTHESLLQYLVEECYELYQAIEDGDGAAVREELGDVLLQVLFHARVAAEAESEGGAPASASFDIDDVAADLVTKLVGRHPHVF